MRTSSFLPVWEGLGEFSLGLYELITPEKEDIKERKTKKLGIDSMILETINLTIKQFESYKKRAVIESLANILTGDQYSSIATSQLFEIVVPAFCKKEIVSSKNNNFLYSVYQELENKESADMGHFFRNAIFLVRNYNLGDYYWTEKWLTDMADLSIKQKKKDNLFSKMLIAIATDTEHEDILGHTLSTITKKNEHLGIYWQALKTILKSDNNDKILGATSFIMKDDRYLSVNPLLAIEDIEGDGQKVINVLTWDYNRQRSYFPKNKSDVELFCILTSKKPRQQLLNAWRVFTTDKEINQKGLILLSRRADEKLPRKKGDDISVIVTPETFKDFFPLLQS